jgi:hypothetical protein
MKTSGGLRGSSILRVPVLCLALSVLGCRQPQPGAETTSPTDPVSQEVPQTSTAAANPLPADIPSAIRKDYGNDARYLDASSDLNGDSVPETLVYVVGMMSCGSGGCNLLVFTPEGSGHRLVSTLSVTNLPNGASAGRLRLHGARTRALHGLVLQPDRSKERGHYSWQPASHCARRALGQRRALPGPGYRFLGTPRRSNTDMGPARESCANQGDGVRRT